MTNDMQKKEKLVESFREKFEKAKALHDGDNGVLNLISMNVHHLNAFEKNQEPGLEEHIQDLYDTLEEAANDRQRLLDLLQDSLQYW